MSERPRDGGFIRPDGSWADLDPGDYDEWAQHADVAADELRRLRRRPSQEARANRRHQDPGVAELLRRGYVRQGESCNFEVWSLDRLSSDARAEMELTYLEHGCHEVLIDQIVGGPKYITPTYNVGGLGSYLQRGRR
ncbi:MAG: hypothetical protein Q8S13_14530 [Dehalococcoidia bacterium]|nr:hypothetical protein [Dehalococcoidia bacterium]